MFCKNCGNEINNNDKFCSKCGKEVQNTIETSTLDNVDYLDKPKKLVKISLICTIISFIMVAITSNGNDNNIVWNISKIVFAISLITYCIGIIMCTVISITKKQKLKGWISTVQFITIVILITGIVIAIGGVISRM